MMESALIWEVYLCLEISHPLSLFLLIPTGHPFSFINFWYMIPASTSSASRPHCAPRAPRAGHNLNLGFCSVRSSGVSVRVMLCACLKHRSSGDNWSPPRVHFEFYLISAHPKSSPYIDSTHKIVSSQAVNKRHWCLALFFWWWSWQFCI